MARLPPFAACLIPVAALVACKTTPKKRPAPAPAEAAAHSSGPLDQIEAWEDQRSLDGGTLVQWATGNPDPNVRARSFLALARIQDPATAEAITQGLRDPEPAVRAEAAFAAGQLGLSWDPLPPPVKDALTLKLLDAELAEPDATVRVAQLEALGKVGTPPTLDRLTERLLGASVDARERAALSLGVAAKRGAALPPKALTALGPMIKKDAGAPLRFSAAYALALSKQAGARAPLLVCTQDELAEVRSLCARGLGEVGLDADAVTLKKLLGDPDYRVAVEATRSLAKLAARCKANACPAIGALADLSFRAERFERGDAAGGGQPLLALAQQGLPAAGRPLLANLRARLMEAATKAAPALKKDLAQMDCRLAAAMDRQAGVLAEVLNCGGEVIPEARRLQLGLQEISQAPAKDAPARARDVSSYLLHSDAKVKLAAIEALGENKASGPVDRLRPFITGPDLVLAGAAASAAGKLGDRAALAPIRARAGEVSAHPDVADSFAEGLVALKAKDAEPELRAWLASPNAHVRSVAAKALTELTGQPVVAPRVELAAEKKPALPKGAQLHVKTERGEIDILLFGDDAPRNAGNIFQLAKKGFFKNLTFHRVVPDFVVQGGDPRGDGEGGPGYTVRCEMNHKPYTRGAVGMALSGKDTGGSQWFITTFPQPHLEGRYTVFGQVTNGQEVVDSLLEDDRILDVRATP